MTLLRRILSSAVLLTPLFLVLFFGNAAWFGFVGAAFCALALFEFFSLLRGASIPCFRLFGTVMGAVIPLVVVFEHGATESGDVLFIVLGCLLLFIQQFTRKDHSDALIGIALTIFGILYVSWFLTFVIKIRYLEGGAMWAAYIISVTKSADIGAYMAGTAIGRRPLIPFVSPKKTVEGLFGGLALSTLASCLFAAWLPQKWSLGHLAILGLLIGVVGQIGDLSESVMKRFCKAKDSSAILPGMGGILDAVDSILFTAPMFYFHLRLFL